MDSEDLDEAPAAELDLKNQSKEAFQHSALFCV